MIVWRDDPTELPERFTQHHYRQRHRELVNRFISLSKAVLLPMAVLFLILAMVIVVAVVAWRAL